MHKRGCEHRVYLRSPSKTSQAGRQLRQELGHTRTVPMQSANIPLGKSEHDLEGLSLLSTEVRRENRRMKAGIYVAL